MPQTIPRVPASQRERTVRQYPALDRALVMKILSRHRRKTLAQGPVTRYPYGLTAPELVDEVQKCRAGGWADWEVGQVFGSRWAA